MKSEFGWTVVCSGGVDIRVYRRDCPATGPAADLAHCTFASRDEAREFARFWEEAEPVPRSYRPGDVLVETFSDSRRCYVERRWGCSSDCEGCNP